MTPAEWSWIMHALKIHQRTVQLIHKAGQAVLYTAQGIRYVLKGEGIFLDQFVEQQRGILVD